MVAEDTQKLSVSDVRPPEAGTSKSILIVEDNADTLRLLECLMVAEGYEVQTADGATAALTLLYSFRPDAILMDIRLPGMDGLQLTRLLKLARGKKHVPVVAVSANGDATAIQAAYDAGCDGYITKPVDTRTFATDIGQYLDPRD